MASAPKDQGRHVHPHFFEAKVKSLILIIGHPDLYYNYYCALPLFIVTGRLCTVHRVENT